VEEMGVTNTDTRNSGAATINPARYGKLCAQVIPKVIESDHEFDRLVEKMEALDRKKNPTPEEEALSELLMKLIQDYDDTHYPIPDGPPHEIIRHLMEHRGLKQADLVPQIGSRSQVSDMVTGKRSVSKAQARKLGEFFKVSPALFI
jgi:HTH-type transcriptional regulator/antitoxin HigA